MGLATFVQDIRTSLMRCEKVFHITIGNRILASMHPGEKRTVRLNDGHMWDITLNGFGEKKGLDAEMQRHEADVSRRHSPHCPCHSTFARGSAEFATMAERAARYLAK